MKNICYIVSVFLLFCMLLPCSAVDDLTAGRAAAEDGLHEIAVRHLSSALKLGGQNSVTRGRALALLLTSYDALGQYEALLSALDNTDRATLDAGERGFWRARALLSLSRSDEALEVLAELGTPANEFWLGRVERLRARCLVEKGRTDDAMAVLRDAVKALPPSEMRTALDVDWARLAFLSGRYADADSVLARVPVQESSPELRQEAAVLRGRCLLALRRFPQAAALLASLGRDDALEASLRAEAWSEAARAYQAMREPVRELDALSAALELVESPDAKHEATFRLGIRELANGQTAAGEARLQQMIREAPDSPYSSKSQLALAEALREMGRAEDALTGYTIFLETFGDSPGVGLAQRGRGWALLSLERYSEASMAFLKAYDTIKDEDMRIECLFKAGDAFFLNEQYGKASEVFNQITASFPESMLAPRAALQAAECLVREDRIDDAEALFKDVSRVYTGKVAAAEALLRVGQLHEDRGNVRSALSAYDSVLTATTNRQLWAEALFGRGVVYYRKYDFADAYADFSRAVETGASTPTAEHAAYLRFLSAFRHGQDAHALELCDQFLKSYPESKWHPDAMFWRGNVYYNKGVFDLSGVEFLALVSRYPAHKLADDALLWAGRSAARRREFQLVIELLSRMPGEYPQSTLRAAALFEQAEAMCERADFNQAIVLFDKMIVQFPANDLVPYAWGRKGDCLFSLGTDDAELYEDAIGAYRTVAQHRVVPMGLALRVEYMIGRCMEKEGRSEDALEQYHVNVIVRYRKERETGNIGSVEVLKWYAKAAFNAADLLVSKQRWTQAVSVLERVIQVGGPGRTEALDRIERIKDGRRWLFR